MDSPQTSTDFGFRDDKKVCMLASSSCRKSRDNFEKIFLNYSPGCQDDTRLVLQIPNVLDLCNDRQSFYCKTSFVLVLAFEDSLYISLADIVHPVHAV